MTDETVQADATFAGLGVAEPLLQVLTGLGYEAPTPIQEQSIPALLAGRDLVGQAQTGTGKTAAFALPMLQRADPASRAVQGLVLVPTRELALQVAEALHTYAKNMGRIHVLPVYGGAPFPPQLKGLQRGAHIVVGTPGRVMDHVRRGSLVLSELRTAVLDEADEMLRMGFIDDVEWILSQTPATRQTALFTATMPPRVRAVAQRYLTDPLRIDIARKTLTVPTVQQYYLNLSENQKLDALTRILGIEPTEGVLVFARTKNGAAELAEKLDARGIAAEALHGDMTQAMRESLVRRFRARQVDVLVATDVAARGLDVEHISHVFNYDIPNDVEAYVHRIGRTGRAGRSGIAVLFAVPRERRMLRDIERYTGSRMEPMKMPTQADVASRTIALFVDSVRKSVAAEGLDVYLALVEQLAEEGFDMAEIAAGAVRVAMEEKKIEVALEPEKEEAPGPEEGMTRLFLSVGTKAGVTPSDVVGAIANEAGIPGREIGVIDVYERFTFVEVPTRYRDKVLAAMAKATIRGRPVHIKPADAERGERGTPAARREKSAGPKGPGRTGSKPRAARKPYKPKPGGRQP